MVEEGGRRETLIAAQVLDEQHKLEVSGSGKPQPLIDYRPDYAIKP